jgi:hypothetical protein
MENQEVESSCEHVPYSHTKYLVSLLDGTSINTHLVDGRDEEDCVGFNC